LHIYAGSQNLDAVAIGEANHLSLQLASELATQCEFELASLNIGGGFGIPYFENERDLDIEAVGVALRDSIAAHAPALRGTELIVELGRYLVGEAGYYVTRVLDIKTSRGERFAVVDGGLHHHLANSGNFGQVLRKNYPSRVGNKLAAAADSAPVSIVGPLVYAARYGSEERRSAASRHWRSDRRAAIRRVWLFREPAGLPWPPAAGGNSGRRVISRQRARTWPRSGNRKRG